MSENTFCQSCSMPLTTDELFGTEADGSKNKDYCKFCYKNGAFTNPDFSLDQMKSHMMQVMEAEKLPEDILEAAIRRLPNLKRWKAAAHSDAT